MEEIALPVLLMLPAALLLVAIVAAILLTYVAVHRHATPRPVFRGAGCLVVFAGLILLSWLAIGPINVQRHAAENMAMQSCRTIALAEFQYANDNNGTYPTGASSTEVFRKLMDGNYVSDPSLFFIPMPGKTKATSTNLNPDNVCYDVTADVAGNSPSDLPVVFITGFRIQYKPSGSAISLTKPFPRYRKLEECWLGLLGFGSDQLFDGLAVAYKSNNAFFQVSHTIRHTTIPFVNADGFGVVPNVIPADFDPRGRVFCQLTPTGVLK